MTFEAAAQRDLHKLESITCSTRLATRATALSPASAVVSTCSRPLPTFTVPASTCTRTQPLTLAAQQQLVTFCLWQHSIHWDFVRHGADQAVQPTSGVASKACQHYCRLHIKANIKVLPGRLQTIRLDLSGTLRIQVISAIQTHRHPTYYPLELCVHPSRCNLQTKGTPPGPRQPS